MRLEVIFAAVVAALPTSAQEMSHAFDGSYVSTAFDPKGPISFGPYGIRDSEVGRYGFRIIGTRGLATISNSPTYKVGEVMLIFAPSGPDTFIGQQKCTDGNFYPVTGALKPDRSLEMASQSPSCIPSTWTMTRADPAAPQGDELVIGIAGDVAVEGASGIAQTFAETPALDESAGLAMIAGDVAQAVGERVENRIILQNTPGTEYDDFLNNLLEDNRQSIRNGMTLTQLVEEAMKDVEIVAPDVTPDMVRNKLIAKAKEQQIDIQQ